MTILNKAEIEELKAESQEGLLDWPDQTSLLDTLDAMREALKAWARWATMWPTDVDSMTEETEAFNIAVQLTKEAGIEWKEDLQP